MPFLILGRQEQHLRLHLDHRDEAVLRVLQLDGHQAQEQGARPQPRADRHHPSHRVQQPQQEHSETR